MRELLRAERRLREEPSPKTEAIRNSRHVLLETELEKLIAEHPQSAPTASPGADK